MTREDELIGELQREKHLRQLDNQERSKLKVRGVLIDLMSVTFYLLQVLHFTAC
jgi:hypothetical protein